MYIATATEAICFLFLLFFVFFSSVCVYVNIVSRKIAIKMNNWRELQIFRVYLANDRGWSISNETSIPLLSDWHQRTKKATTKNENDGLNKNRSDNKHFKVKERYYSWRNQCALSAWLFASAFRDLARVKIWTPHHCSVELRLRAYIKRAAASDIVNKNRINYGVDDQPTWSWELWVLIYIGR